MVLLDRGVGRFVESPLDKRAVCNLVPSNGIIPDWRRLEGGEITAGGNFVRIELEKDEEKAAEVRLKVTSMIFFKPEAWSKITVSLVLGPWGWAELVDQRS